MKTMYDADADYNEILKLVLLITIIFNMKVLEIKISHCQLENILMLSDHI